jgi:hypothetical protein
MKTIRIDQTFMQAQHNQIREHKQLTEAGLTTIVGILKQIILLGW